MFIIGYQILPDFLRTQNGKLTAFPHDIPHDLQKIEIRNSDIRFIEYIDPFPELQLLRIINVSQQRQQFSQVAVILW